MSKVPEIKKHYTQFTVQEQKELERMQKHLKIGKYTPHGKKRMKERGIDKIFQHVDFLETIICGNIIEVKLLKKKKKEMRILFRSKFARQGYNLVVSYSVTHKEIVSAWLNHSTDDHSTVDLTKYNDDLDVMKVIKGVRWYMANRNRKGV